MEKAVLKTLIYANIFDYPLKIWEIYKWLIQTETDLPEVEKAVKRLFKKGKIEIKKDIVSLKDRRLFSKRIKREEQSVSYFKKAEIISSLLKVIPWIKLVGISGGLAMENADKKDDIDLFVITQKNRLWLSRIFILLILTLTFQRRKATDNKSNSSGKICPNLLLEEDQLVQEKQDLYTAHEVLQMKVLWQREDIYSKYLEDNNWAFKFLPNWTTSSSPRRRGSNSDRELFNWIPASAGMTVENLARRFQLWMMSKPRGSEKIEDHSLYFHPKDYRKEVLEQYKAQLDIIL